MVFRFLKHLDAVVGYFTGKILELLRNIWVYCVSICDFDFFISSFEEMSCDQEDQKAQKGTQQKTS